MITDKRFIVISSFLMTIELFSGFWILHRSAMVSVFLTCAQANRRVLARPCAASTDLSGAQQLRLDRELADALAGGGEDGVAHGGRDRRGGGVALGALHAPPPLDGDLPVWPPT